MIGTTSRFSFKPCESDTPPGWIFKNLNEKKFQGHWKLQGCYNNCASVLWYFVCFGVQLKLNTSTAVSSTTSSSPAPTRSLVLHCWAKTFILHLHWLSLCRSCTVAVSSLNWVCVAIKCTLDSLANQLCYERSHWDCICTLLNITRCHGGLWI